jgi:Uma2 family endonuclease
MAITEEAFRRMALEDPNGLWELHCGVPRRKPGMTASHNEVMTNLFASLYQQLDRNQYRVRSNAGHVRRSAENCYIPDVFVIPADMVRPQLGTMDLETYPEALPLVVEIWSPSTGRYEIESKLLEYQRRGDLEIWRIHPYERTLTTWRRQPNGTYSETLHTGGMIRPIALRNVSIDLDALFA